MPAPAESIHIIVGRIGGEKIANVVPGSIFDAVSELRDRQQNNPRAHFWLLALDTVTGHADTYRAAETHPVTFSCDDWEWVESHAADNGLTADEYVASLVRRDREH